MISKRPVRAVIALAFLLGLGPHPLHAAEPLTPVDMTKTPPGVERIDLFLLIGQSNMKGRGLVPAEQTLNPRIVMLHIKNDQWYLAQHPVHITQAPMTVKGKDNAGVGPGLAFGEIIAAQNPHVQVGLVPCAVGGSKLALWMKGGKLYENTVRRARLALGMKATVPVVLRGALWLQGEADSTPALQPSYQARLTQMIDDLRADLAAPKLPFIVATIGNFDGPVHSDPTHKALINEALLALPKLRQHTACVDARDLKGHIGDYVHYNTESQTIIGQRYAEKYFQLKDKQ